MKRILTALTLSAVLASPAWSTSDSYYILNGGKILYDQTVSAFVGDRPMKTQEVGVAYKGKIYVCQITLNIIVPISQVRCFNTEDKGLYSVNSN